jgi:hypothetical protein
MLYGVNQNRAASTAIAPGDRLSLGELMVLIAGAALGIGLLPVGSAVHFPVTGPFGLSLQGLLIVSYGTISGITMAAMILLIASRVRAGRPWGPAAVSLFVARLTAWVFLPMVIAGWIRNSGAFEPLGLFLRIHLAHSPATYAYEAFYYFWPVACFAFLIGCSLSGQAGRWWTLRGWWAEWLGMWMLVVWSVPSIVIMAGFIRTYLQ